MHAAGEIIHPLNEDQQTFVKVSLLTIFLRHFAHFAKAYSDLAEIWKTYWGSIGKSQQKNCGKQLNFCHAQRLNLLKEQVENWYVTGRTGTKLEISIQRLGKKTFK